MTTIVLTFLDSVNTNIGYSISRMYMGVPRTVLSYTKYEMTVIRITKSYTKSKSYYKRSKNLLLIEYNCLFYGKNILWKIFSRIFFVLIKSYLMKYDCKLHGKLNGISKQIIRQHSNVYYDTCSEALSIIQCQLCTKNKTARRWQTMLTKSAVLFIVIFYETLIISSTVAQNNVPNSPQGSSGENR